MPGFGQLVGATFQNMKNMGLEFDALDHRYASPVHADASLAPLKDSTEQNKYLETYYEYMEGLGKYLFKGDRPWSKPFMIFLKIYFTADGKAEYFLYNLSGPKEERPDSVALAIFEKAVAQYFKDNPFPMPFYMPFGQCGPMVVDPGKQWQKQSPQARFQ